MLGLPLCLAVFPHNPRHPGNNCTNKGVITWGLTFPLYPKIGTPYSDHPIQSSTYKLISMIKAIINPLSCRYLTHT